MTNCETCGEPFTPTAELERHCSHICKYIGRAPRRPINHKGEKVGRLTCISDTGVRSGRHPVWLWVCDCGNFVRRVYWNAVKTGRCHECPPVHMDLRVGDSVTTPSGRSAVVHAIRSDGRVGIRYADGGTGCTLLAAMLTRQRG